MRGTYPPMSRRSSAVRTVRDVMASRVVAGTPGESLAAIAGRMTRERVGAIALTGAGRLTGIITERDLVRAVARGLDPRTTRAEECMTGQPMTVRQDDSLADAAALMRVLGVRHLPVIADGKPVGFLSARDTLPASGMR